MSRIYREYLTEELRSEAAEAAMAAAMAEQAATEALWAEQEALWESCRQALQDGDGDLYEALKNGLA